MSGQNSDGKDMLPDFANYSKIEEGLFLGNLTAALDIATLKELHISHILTIDSKPLPSNISSIPGLQLCYIEANDMSNEDLLSHFPQMINFISDGQCKGNVLVHCYFGVSRSACGVIAYLMKKYGLKVNEALERVKLKRKFIGPNSGFLSQLLLYQNLNYTLDIDKNSFRLYRLTVAGEAFKRGKFSPEKFSDIIWKNDKNHLPSLTVKCHMCRCLLGTESSILPHGTGTRPHWLSDVDASVRCVIGLFSTPCDWMPNIRSPQGKIYCPKCQHKIGSYNWIKGSVCPCGASLIPGFFFVPSKVDVCRSLGLTPTQEQRSTDVP